MNKASTLPTARKVCASCAFHAMESMQGQIMRQMVCHRMPPTVSMITTPQGIQGMTLFPVVQPAMYCYEWRPREPDPAPEKDTEGEGSTMFFNPDGDGDPRLD